MAKPIMRTVDRRVRNLLSKFRDTYRRNWRNLVEVYGLDEETALKLMLQTVLEEHDDIKRGRRMGINKTSALRQASREEASMNDYAQQFMAKMEGDEQTPSPIHTIEELRHLKEAAKKMGQIDEE